MLYNTMCIGRCHINISRILDYEICCWCTCLAGVALAAGIAGIAGGAGGTGSVATLIEGHWENS